MTLKEKLNATLNNTQQNTATQSRSLRDQIAEQVNAGKQAFKTSATQSFADRVGNQQFSATPFTGIDARVAADKTAAQRRNQAIDEAIRKQYGISADEYRNLYASTEAAQKYVDDLQGQYNATGFSTGGRHFETESGSSFMGVNQPPVGGSSVRNSGIMSSAEKLFNANKSNYSTKEISGREGERETLAKRLEEAKQILAYRQFKDKEEAVLNKYNASVSNVDYAEKSKAAMQGFSPRMSINPYGVKKGTGILEQIAVGAKPEGLTDEQISNIRYLYNTAGKNAALEYAELFNDVNISETLARSAENIANIENGFGRALSEGAYGATAGLSQFVTGIRNTVRAPFGQTVPDPVAKGNAIIRESIDNVVGKGAYDLVVTTANMVPSIVLSAATGVPALGTAAMGASAGGNAYAQAIAEGKPAYQAIAYGVLNGVSEACLQSIIGGISPLASEEGVTKALTDTIGKTLGKKAAQEGAKTITKVLNKVAEKAAVIGTSALFEGGEEYLQDILEPVFRNICFDENNEFKPFTEEALYSGIIGALSGGMFSGVDLAKNDIINGALKYSTDEATKGESALNKAISGETLTDAEVKSIAQDYTYRQALSKESGIEIMGSNSERRSLVKKAVETIQQRANTAANPEAVNADINAGVAGESAIDLARQATADEAARSTVTPTENAQNINVAQSGSQRVTEGLGENVDARIADFANPKKNYTRTADAVNTPTGTVNDDGSITYTKSDGTTDTFRSLRDISDMLMDNLGFNFVGKLPDSKGVAGYYAASEDMIRSMYSDVSTIAHEVGHWLDKNFDLQSDLNMGELERLYKKDVKRLYKEEQVDKELVAELTREYFRNSEQLKADHPEIYEQFENALKKAGGNIYDTIRTAADMFNAYTSLAEEQRYKTKVTDAEIEKKRKKDEKTTSMREKVNKFLFNYFDSALPLKIGSEEAYRLQTMKNGNLPMVIQSAIVDAVRDQDGAKVADGWSAIYNSLTEGMTEKEAAKVRKNFNEYLLLLDIQDSLTIGQRYDEPTRVSKTLEAADRTRIIEAKNNINKALAALENADYRALRDTLNNLIANISYSVDVRNALSALERALPRYNINNNGAYSLTNLGVSNLINDLAKQIKGLSVDDLAQFQTDLGSLAVQYVDDATFTALFNTLTDLVTRVDEDAIKQRVFTTEENLNEATETQKRIDELLAESPDFAEAEKMVRTWYGALQELMVKAGIWTQEQLDVLRRLHPHYIGLHRAVNVGESRAAKIKARVTESKGFDVDSGDDMLNYTRKGSDKDIYDAFEQACYFANNVIQRVTNNSIIATFYREAINDKTVAFEDIRMKGNEPNSLTFYENGKEHTFYVNDPLILAALKWEKPSIGSLYAVRTVTNLTKKFATQYNPAFVARNVIRDVQQAYRNGSEDNVIKFAGDWFKSLYEVSKSEWAKNRSERAKTPEARAKWKSRISETYTAAQAAGLEGAAPWRGMNSQAMNAYRTEVGLSKKNAIQKAFGAINDAITAVADATETATRYAEVKRQLNSGDPTITMADAVLAGQELTTNFTRQGASKAYRILDTFIPFLSANIQGSYNNIKQIFAYDPKTGKVSMTEDAGKKIAKTVGIWAIPAILQYALLYLDFGDGEDREKKLEAFRAETNYVKNTYWLVWLGDDTFLKIPKSQILNPAFTAIERTLDTLAADDPQAFNSFLDYAIDQILLGQFTDLTNITGAGTVYALAANKDWRGVTIDTAKEYNQNLSPRYHYDENTSFPAKWLGNIINVSPQQIDYVIGDVIPFAGSFLKDTTSEKAIKDIKQNPVGTIFSALGLKSGLTADSVYSTDIKREYYNYKAKVNTTANDAKNVYTPDTPTSKAQKFGKGLAQNTNYTAFQNYIAGTISTAIKDMTDPSEKRKANKALNQLMTALSGTHGETAKGGTQLDKDIAALYSDYSTYSADIGDTSLGYWLSQVSANGKTYKVKEIVVTDDPSKTVENAVKYYAYVDKMLNGVWDSWSKTPEYAAATPKEKLDKYLKERKNVCYVALKLIESENENGK